MLFIILLISGLAVGAFFLIRRLTETEEQRQKRKDAKIKRDIARLHKQGAKTDKLYRDALGISEEKIAEKEAEKARKQAEAVAECEASGHNFAPETGASLKREEGVFLQIDNHGYQKEVCKRCGLRRVSEKRLVVLDAPEIQPEYSSRIIWETENSLLDVGQYTVKMDPEKCSYLYTAQNVDEKTRRGDIFVNMNFETEKSWGTGFGRYTIANESIEKNEDFPLNGTMLKNFVCYSAQGDEHSSVFFFTSSNLLLPYDCNTASFGVSAIVKS